MTLFLKPRFRRRWLVIGANTFRNLSCRGWMSKTAFTLFLMAFIVQGMSGCAWLLDKNTSMNDKTVGQLQVPLIGKEQNQAIAAEKGEKYLDALTYWRRARGAIDRKINSISQKIVEISREHTRRGVAFFEKRDADKAFQEFIDALIYDPTNKVALDYLRNRYQAGRYISYTVKKNDTFASIADTTYGSPFYAFLVAEFSNAGKEKDLTEGKVIRLAAKDSFFSQVLIDYNKNIIQARRLFKNEKYTEALSAARAILANHPGDDEASYIVNMSLFKIGSIQQEQQDYAGAIDSLSQIDPSFKNVKKEIAEIRELWKHKLFSTEAKKNSELLQKAEKLYSQREYLAAREALNNVDSRFGGRDKMLAQVDKQLKIQAEYHFKKGISLFVEEKLAAAIVEWRKTLELDPDNLHAAQSIAKARKLQQRVQEIK